MDIPIFDPVPEKQVRSAVVELLSIRLAPLCAYARTENTKLAVILRTLDECGGNGEPES
jgi:hypothetical protein